MTAICHAHLLESSVVIEAFAILLLQEDRCLENNILLCWWSWEYEVFTFKFDLNRVFIKIQLTLHRPYIRVWVIKFHSLNGYACQCHLITHGCFKIILPCQGLIDYSNLFLTLHSAIFILAFEFQFIIEQFCGSNWDWKPSTFWMRKLINHFCFPLNLSRSSWSFYQKNFILSILMV